MTLADRIRTWVTAPRTLTWQVVRGALVLLTALLALTLVPPLLAIIPAHPATIPPLVLTVLLLVRWARGETPRTQAAAWVARAASAPRRRFVIATAAVGATLAVLGVLTGAGLGTVVELALLGAGSVVLGVVAWPVR